MAKIIESLVIVLMFIIILLMGSMVLVVAQQIGMNSEDTGLCLITGDGPNG